MRNPIESKPCDPEKTHMQSTKHALIVTMGTENIISQSIDDEFAIPWEINYIE